MFLLLILLLAISSAAADLDTYPMPFVEGGNFTAQIIVGGASPSSDVVAAIEISNSLQRRSNTQFSAGLDDEFNQWKNGILIGLPCQNTAIAKVLNTKECDIGLANGTGYLKLVESNGQTFLIVTGKTPADTRKAARLLAQSNVHGLSGTEVMVTGTLDNPQVEKTGQPLETETMQSGCKSDSDCKASEYCSSGTCKDLGCPEGTTAQNHDCVAATEKTAEKEKAQEQLIPAKTAEASATAAQPESKAEEQPILEIFGKKPGFFARIISFFRNIFR
mgnify:CR=1 FL=1